MAGTTEWKVAWKKHTGAWGAAGEDLDAAGTEILIESEAMPHMMPEAIDDANVGDSLTQGVVQGNISGEGTIVLPVRYEGIEDWLAIFMGQDTVALAPGETAGTAYLRTMVFQDAIDGLFGTLGIYKGFTEGLWEYPCCKPSQIELNHSNGKLMLTPTLIPNKCERDEAVQGTTDETMAASTPATRSLLALFNQLTVRVAEVTGSEGNLDANDDLCVTNAQLTINRNLSGVPDSCQAGEVGEPQTDGLPEATLVLSLADYDATSDAFVKDAQKRSASGSAKIWKALVMWEGQEITGSDATPDKNKYTVAFDIPAMQVADGPANASGPGARTSFDLTFRIVTPQTVPDGTDWAWVTAGSTPLRARIINEDSVDIVT